MNKIPVILDCDPGIDDALAIAYGLSLAEVDLKLITTVCGNVPVEVTSKNADDLVALCQMDVQIAKGAEKAMVLESVFADDVHGANGLGGYQLEPTKESKLSNQNAVDAMAQVLMDSDEPVVIIAVGPLTNVAHLLMMYPFLISKISYISLMGGGLTGGNTTPAGEFNIYADPHAAHYVFTSGIRLVMAGLNVTEETSLDKEDVERIQSSSEVGKVLGDILIAARGGINFFKANLHDVVSMMYVVHPELFETENLFVEIETEGLYARGMTIVDRRQRNRQAGNVDVMVGIDRVGFIEKLVKGLKYYG